MYIIIHDYSRPACWDRILLHILKPLSSRVARGTDPAFCPLFLDPWGYRVNVNVASSLSYLGRKTLGYILAELLSCIPRIQIYGCESVTFLSMSKCCVMYWIVNRRISVVKVMRGSISHTLVSCFSYVVKD